MKEHLTTALKGFAMGAANVIPGVSGGTIAFITGIYERLINELRAFDVASLKLLLSFQIREFFEKTDLRFLIALGVGAVVSVVTLAKVLDWAFKFHEVLVWSFFFGLIAASLPAVAKLVKKWNAVTVLALLAGCGIAVSLAFCPPAAENTNPLYLVLCGVVAMSSMIIPGLSGSFVLLLMGNYQLIAIDTVNALSEGEIVESLKIIVPVGIGAVVGLIILSRFLSWLFRNHHDLAVSVIAGFVAGSLLIIWPWKDQVPKTDGDGQIIVKTAERELVGRPGSLVEVKAAAVKADEEVMIAGYENWHLPSFSSSETWLALVLLVAGAGMVVMMEMLSRQKSGAEEGEK